MSKKHSVLSASSCERWWNCPGSIKACENIPNPPNIYTATGTVAHSLAELALKHPKMKLEGQLGVVKIQDGFEVTIDEDMIDSVYQYRDYVLDIWEKEGQPTIQLEVKIQLIEVNEVMFGTSDCVMVIPFKKVHIFDFKNGKGKRVSAWENKQLLYYALGVMLKEDCTEFEIHICQPGIEDGFTSYSGTSDDIYAFHKELEEKAKEALSPKAPLNPGDWCKGTFCPARTNCPALRGLSQELIKQDFAEPADVNSLSIDHIVKVLKYEDTIKDWMAKVRDHAKELMLQGVEIPGYKVVQSFGHAKWLDPEVIAAEFGDEFGEQIYKPKELVSPAQFEKIAGKKRLGKTFRDDYTMRPENGYKIVTSDDTAEAVKTIKAQEDFQ